MLLQPRAQLFQVGIQRHGELHPAAAQAMDMVHHLR